MISARPPGLEARHRSRGDAGAGPHRSGAVGDLDRGDGLRPRRERRPQTERRQEFLVAAERAERASVLAERFGSAASASTSAMRKPCGAELGERKRERAPDEAAAGDHDIEPIAGPCCALRQPSSSNATFRRAQ